MSDKKIKVPVLNETAADVIRNFVKAYNIYSRSGMKSMVECIEPDTWSLIKLKLERRGLNADVIGEAESVDLDKRAEANAACKKCLRASCAPLQLEQALSHLSEVTLDTVGEDAALKYIEAFEIRVEELKDIGSPVASDTPYLIRTFQNNIRHSSLHRELHSARPTTMVEAKTLLLEAVDYLLTSRHHRERQEKAQDKTDKHKQKQASSSKQQEASGKCKKHPNFSHTWEECRSNPKNQTPGSATGNTTKGPSVAAPTAWNRPQGQRLQRAQMALKGNKDEHLLADHLTSPSSKDVDEDEVGMPAVPRYLSATVHTDSRPQRHVAFVDTGADVNMVSKDTAARLLQLGCKTVQPPVKRLILANSTEIQIEQALTLDVTFGTADEQFRTTATFVVMETTDDLVIGYHLLNTLGSKLRLWLKPTPKSPEPTQRKPQDEAETKDLPRVVFDGAPEAKERMETFLNQHRDCFRHQAPTDMMNMDPVHIDLVRPLPKIPPRKIPAAYMEDVDNMINEWLETGIIRPSTSPYSNPLVMVRKREHGEAQTNADKNRLCLDLRVLNKCIDDDPYPLPNMRDLVDTIVGHEYYAKLDIRSAYLQVPLDDHTSRLLAFTTPTGHWEMRRLPFGVKTSPAIFQRTINNILAGLVNVICVIYMDDCCVFGDTADELVQRVETVIRRLQQNNVLLKASKCTIGTKEVDYLGHIVSKHGITMAPSRTHGLADLPAPKDKRQLLSFLGAAAWFRRFVPRFAMIAQPLYALTRNGAVYHWGEQEERAFNELKQAVISNAMLFSFNADLPTILRTDACNLGIGAVLFQTEDEVERPIGFYSRSLSTVEQMYSTVEQEALSIIEAVKHFEYYLLGRSFTIETDSKNNTFIFTCNNAKVLRWRLLLQNFDYDIRHIPGRTNVVSDYLSRAFQLTDIEERIATVHSDITGHMGITATIKRLEDQHGKWKTMRQDVTTFIQNCPTCAKTRLRHKIPDMEPRSIEAWQPFESISVDFVGPMTADAENNTYIVCCIDNFTRFVELFPAKDASAFAAARALLSVFCRYGAPLEVRSDKGPHFAAEIIRQFLGLCDVKQRFSLPYHPQANGLVERAIQECNRHLRALVMDRTTRENWSIALPLVQRIMNSTPHSAIGVAPAVLLYGNHCDLDRNLFTVPAEDLTLTTVPKQLQLLMDCQAELVEAAQRHQAAVIDKRLETNKEPITLEDGETVLLRPPHDRPASKLAPRLLGPYKVISKTGTNSYNIRLVNAPETDEPIEVHMERLIPYTPPTDAALNEIIAADKPDEYLVESIRNHRRAKPGNRASSFHYLVKWQGYEDPTWETSAALKDNVFFKDYLISNNIAAR